MKPHRALVFLFLSLAGCARQGSIPNTDRFPPHLVSVTSNYDNQLSAKFDDLLDTKGLLPATFSIMSATDTAQILYVAKDDADRYSLLIITSPLDDETYTLSGLVTDRNGNAATVKKTFRPSTRSDTMEPSILISPMDGVAGFPFEITARFSEPIDSSRKTKFVTAPWVAPDNISEQWNKSLMEYTLTCNDSTVKDRAFYIVFLPPIRDFAGNSNDYGVATYVYQDTSLEFREIIGSISSSSGKLEIAVLLFKTDDNVFALSVSDSTGDFQTSVLEQDSITVEVWVDANGDWFFEEYVSRFYSQLPERIELISAPQSPSRRFNELVPAVK